MVKWTSKNALSHKKFLPILSFTSLQNWVELLYWWQGKIAIIHNYSVTEVFLNYNYNVYIGILDFVLQILKIWLKCTRRWTSNINILTYKTHHVFFLNHLNKQIIDNTSKNKTNWIFLNLTFKDASDTNTVYQIYVFKSINFG